MLWGDRLVELGFSSETTALSGGLVASDISKRSHKLSFSLDCKVSTVDSDGRMQPKEVIPAFVMADSFSPNVGLCGNSM